MKNQCKNCGARISWNPNTQSLTCPMCGSSFAVAKVPFSNWQILDETSEIQRDKNKHTSYVCSSCGSEHSVQGEEELTRCPSCGSVQIEKRSSFSFVANGIVPFKISKERAQAALIHWISSRVMAPRALKKLFKAGKMSPYYIPYYSYLYDMDASYAGVAEYSETIWVNGPDGQRHARTKVSRRRFSNQISCRDEYGQMCASSKMSHLNFGYDLKDLVQPKNEFQFGFSALEKDVPMAHLHADLMDAANSQIQRSARRDAGFGTILTLNTQSNVYNKRYALNLMPVWVTHYEFKGTRYSCYVDGQRGNVVGHSPISGWKLFAIVFGIIAAIAGATLLAVLL